MGLAGRAARSCRPCLNAVTIRRRLPSDRGAYIASLELIRDLDFDVLVPWAATVGQPFHTVTDRADARRRIAAILERLRRGDDH